MELAGKRLLATDGSPIPLTLESNSKQEHVTIEFWGLAIPEGIYGSYGDHKSSDDGYNAPGRATGNNTYKAVRVISEEYNIYYAVWCTNEAELYDLKVWWFFSALVNYAKLIDAQTDPGEMRNLLSAEHSSMGYSLRSRPISQIIARLDALIMVLKSCKGQSCVEPWKELHPAGDVSTLLHSLEPSFDAFYEKQPKVSFTECKLGYFPEFEGPMEFNQYRHDQSPWGGWWGGELKRDAAPESRYRGHWSVWT